LFDGTLDNGYGVGVGVGDDDDGSFPSSSSSSTCEMCGWLAALTALVAFGSFGVPVKSKVATSLDIDPLVMQSYKTAMCFITSWIFLLVRGEKFAFTPWGIVSGLFWVPGGVATIYAIKTAGLAIGIGVGSSFIVLVSFSWGIFFFDEHVHSRVQACSAVAFMLCGLVGMAYYSAPTVAHAAHTHNRTANANDGNVNIDDPYYHPIRPEDLDFLPPDAAFETDYTSMDVETAGDNDNDNDNNADNNNVMADSDRHNESMEISNNPIIDGDDDDENEEDDDSLAQIVTGTTSLFFCWGYLRVQERILGIMAALLVTGIWGGSIMVPMQFAPKIDKGLPYLTSFAIGATLVTLSLWLFRYLYLCHKHSYSVSTAYRALPSFHFSKMWPYGCTCGLLWSIGNFFSIVAVENLGEGVGYSASQASMLVSGLWGIFYFKEIEGADAILKWYASASVTALGIVLLSYEHHEQ